MQDYNYLAHHGILGQRWGVRRFQNEDGSLIHPKGKKHLQKKMRMNEKQPKKEIMKYLIVQ